MKQCSLSSKTRPSAGTSGHQEETPTWRSSRNSPRPRASSTDRRTLELTGFNYEKRDSAAIAVVVEPLRSPNSVDLGSHLVKEPVVDSQPRSDRPEIEIGNDHLVDARRGVFAKRLGQSLR
jgi:hypothetical protein